MEWLKKVTSRHQEWVYIASTFGTSTPEDLVQEMYVYLIENEQPYRSAYDKRVSSLPMEERLFNNEGELNSCYVWIILRNEYLKSKDKLKTQPIGEGFFIRDTDNNQEQEARIRLSNKIDKVIKTFHWYDKMLFNLYINEKETAHNRKGKGYTMRELADKTGISLTSIYNTLKNCKTIIEDEVGEDLIDLLNEDFELIK